jgi:chromosome partitioning protein
MLQFIASKKIGEATPIPHILFNMTPRVGTEAIETTIRTHSTFSAHCMDSKFTKYTAFSEPDGGKGFVWASKKPYSTEAFINLFAVATEFIDRTGA